jgi:hypothetical protein
MSNRLPSLRGHSRNGGTPGSSLDVATAAVTNSAVT